MDVVEKLERGASGGPPVRAGSNTGSAGTPVVRPDPDAGKPPKGSDDCEDVPCLKADPTRPN